MRTSHILLVFVICTVLALVAWEHPTAAAPLGLAVAAAGVLALVLKEE